ncbi:MAG: hypothetical protein IT261_05335 [Saprospiraceae bacterium]|nr:hypothetical protein [Saprospiraceae bacterium]
MKPIITLMTILLTSSLFAQGPGTNAEYKRVVAIGLGELQKGQCAPCLEAYDRAFTLSQHSALSFLRAASCAQLCGDNNRARELAEKAVEISFESTLYVFDHTQEYPELTPFVTSKPGKKTLALAKKAAKNAGGKNSQVQKPIE